MTAATKIVTTTAIIRMSVQDLRLSPETVHLKIRIVKFGKNDTNR